MLKVSDYRSASLSKQIPLFYITKKAALQDCLFSFSSLYRSQKDVKIRGSFWHPHIGQVVVMFGSCHQIDGKTRTCPEQDPYRVSTGCCRKMTDLASAHYQNCATREEFPDKTITKKAISLMRQPSYWDKLILRVTDPYFPA
jgi:hypothetical protein